jgi:hypothetical protein
MWDPVVSGAAYLDTLEAMQAEMIATRRGGPPPREVLGDELLGVPYPDALRRELASIDLTAMQWPNVDATVIATQDGPDYRSLVRTAGDGITYEVVEDAGGWDDLASSYSSLLPVRVPSRIAELFGEGS